MKKHRLGKTGIDVSEVSFGTVSLGLPYGIGISNESDMLCETDSIALLNQGLDRGINFYDTALAYGKSEQIIGKAFCNKRDKVVICSKPAHLHDSFKGQNLPNDKEILSSLENSITQSLTSLKTDYIDIYMSHDGTEQVIKNDTVLDFYQNLKQKGIIKATGISVYTFEQSIAAIKSGLWDVIQLQFNLMDQRQLPAIELAMDKGIGIVVRSALFRGILTDRACDLHPELTSVQQHRQNYFPFIKGDITSLSELATKFVLSIKGVSSVLIGIDRLEYLEQALNVVNGKHLDEQTLSKAKKLAYPEPDFLNLPKWDRNSWL